MHLLMVVLVVVLLGSAVLAAAQKEKVLGIRQEKTLDIPADGGNSTGGISLVCPNNAQGNAIYFSAGVEPMQVWSERLDSDKGFQPVIWNFPGQALFCYADTDGFEYVYVVTDQNVIYRYDYGSNSFRTMAFGKTVFKYVNTPGHAVAFKDPSSRSHYDSVAFTSGNSVHVFTARQKTYDFDYSINLGANDTILSMAHHKHFFFFGMKGGGFIAYNCASGHHERFSALGCEGGQCDGTFILKAYSLKSREGADLAAVIFASKLSMASFVVDLNKEPTSRDFVQMDGGRVFPNPDAGLFKSGCFAPGHVGKSLFVVNGGLNRPLPAGQTRFTRYDWTEFTGNGTGAPTMERVADLADVHHVKESDTWTATPVEVHQQLPHACAVMKSRELGWILVAGYTDTKMKTRIACATQEDLP